MLSLLSRWFGRLRLHREVAALERRAIPDDLWKRTLVRFPFLRRRDDPGATELRRLTALFLDRKEFHAVGALKLTDVMAVSIAAQAALPVLRLGLHRYDDFVGIVVHADQVSARREHIDQDGIAHAYDEILAGEAARGGPVMLSWRDVRAAGSHWGSAYNVVIHEFAHVLDLAGGEADGVPPLPPEVPVSEWRAQLTQSKDAFVQRLQRELPSCIDPYAAQADEEFFAVCSECFFVSPEALQDEDPSLYGMLTRFYKQDPAAEQPDLVAKARKAPAI